MEINKHGQLVPKPLADNLVDPGNRGTLHGFYEWVGQNLPGYGTGEDKVHVSHHLYMFLEDACCLAVGFAIIW
jgi:hypothetical protein